MLRADLRAYARSISTPTLVTGAKIDRVFDCEDVSEVARLAGCESFFYEGSGHAVFDERPDFQQRALEYFERTAGSSGDRE